MTPISSLKCVILSMQRIFLDSLVYSAEVLERLVIQGTSSSRKYFQIEHNKSSSKNYVSKFHKRFYQEHTFVDQSVKMTFSISFSWEFHYLKQRWPFITCSARNFLPVGKKGIELSQKFCDLIISVSVVVWNFIWRLNTIVKLH